MFWNTSVEEVTSDGRGFSLVSLVDFGGREEQQGSDDIP